MLGSRGFEQFYRLCCESRSAICTPPPTSMLLIYASQNFFHRNFAAAIHRVGSPTQRLTFILLNMEGHRGHVSSFPEDKGWSLLFAEHFFLFSSKLVSSSTLTVPLRMKECNVTRSAICNRKAAEALPLYNSPSLCKIGDTGNETRKR